MLRFWQEALDQVFQASSCVPAVKARSGGLPGIAIEPGQVLETLALLTISPSCVRAPSRQGQQLLRLGCGSGRCYFAPLDTLRVAILRIFEVSFKLSPRRESCITLVTLVALVTLALVCHNLFSVNNYPLPPLH